MDSSRNTRQSGRVCQFGFHGSCTGCGEYIRRTSRHAHIHHVGKPAEALCTRCIDTTVAAAGPVLQALQEFGFQFINAETIIELTRDHRLILGIQMDLLAPPDGYRS